MAVLVALPKQGPSKQPVIQWPWMQEIDFQQVDGSQNGGKSGSGLVDVRRDLPKAVRRIFGGTPAQRKAAIHELYSEVLPISLLSHQAPVRNLELRNCNSCFRIKHVTAPATWGLQAAIYNADMLCRTHCCGMPPTS